MSQASFSVKQSPGRKLSRTSGQKSKTSKLKLHHGGGGSKSLITPFRAQGNSKKALNATIGTMKMSKMSLHGAQSVLNGQTTAFNESVASFDEQRRAISLVSAASNIMEDRKKLI